MDIITRLVIFLIVMITVISPFLLVVSSFQSLCVSPSLFMYSSLSCVLCRDIVFEKSY